MYNASCNIDVLLCLIILKYLQQFIFLEFFMYAIGIFKVIRLCVSGTSRKRTCLCLLFLPMIQKSSLVIGANTTKQVVFLKNRNYTSIACISSDVMEQKCDYIDLFVSLESSHYWRCRRSSQRLGSTQLSPASVHAARSRLCHQKT